MSVFRLTADNDLYRPDAASTFERVSGVEQSRQHVRTRLRLFTGEVFRDVRIGVQYFEIVLEPGFSEVAVANHIASVALATPGIADFEMTYEVESIRGVITIDANATYSADDLAVRGPLHENFQITLGGSIATL